MSDAGCAAGAANESDCRFAHESEGPNPAFAIQTVKLNTTEDLREAVRGADLKIVQLAPGSFNGQLTHAQIGTLSLSAGDFEPDLRARGVMNPNLVTIGMMVESDGEVKQWDYDIVPGDIVVFPKGVEQEGRFTGRSRYVTLTLSEEDLALHSAGERALDEPDFWTSIHRLRSSPVVREFIRREIATKVSQLRHGMVPPSAAATAYLRRSLIEAFIIGVLDQQSAEDDNRLRAGSKIVRAVEDYMDALEEEGPVHVSELCLALDLSRRTLHRAFHETLGLGPVEYLRLRRLAQVHRLLTSGETGRINVTQAALEAGFSDLGRFASYYRRLFQETPSRTFQAFQRRSA